VDDVAFVKNMNESLEANKEPLKRQIRDYYKIKEKRQQKFVKKVVDERQ
jgi:hypothetical protein